MAGGESVLCEAARNRNLEQVRQLLDSGDNVNQVDKHGETPLIIASCLGYTEIVSALLVSPDISLNNKTPEGWTALVAAADKGHHGLVRTLLKHRATDVNVRDNQNRTVLMGLCGILDHTQVIHELLCHPDIDIMAVDSEGMTAEKLACAHIKNILVVFKGLKKKVGEYQKLTGELPGIWRLAEECNERAVKAEKSLKEIQDKLEFMGKHHKENDNKNKKQISDLKADNKTKERDLK